MNDSLKPFMPLVDALAETFGKNCEIVLHDFSKPHKSIIKIANSHITDRKIGQPATDLILSYIDKNDSNDDYLVGYKTKNKKGADLKSTTTFIRNSNNNIIGALCINIDITPYITAKNLFEEFCDTFNPNIKNDKQNSPENFESDIDTLINRLINTSFDKIGKPVMHMTKDDKLKIIDNLKENRLFLMKGAHKIVAKKLNVSIGTIYKYLEELR